MKVTILKDAVVSKHSSVFVLKITFMSGDADAHEEIEVTGTRDQIEPALYFLNAFDVTVAHSKDKYCGHMRRLNNNGHYNDDPDWTTLHCAYVAGHFDNYLPAPADAPAGFSRIPWPTDSIVDGDLASLCEWRLEWHDSSGTVWPCSVEYSTWVKNRMKYPLSRILPSHKFTLENSGYWQQIPRSDVIDLSGTQQGVWTEIGWIMGHLLPCERPGADLVDGDLWIGVMYEDGVGNKVWFHHIASKEDFG